MHTKFVLHILLSHMGWISSVHLSPEVFHAVLHIEYIPDFPPPVHATIDHLDSVALLDANLILVYCLVFTHGLVQPLYNKQQQI